MKGMTRLEVSFNFDKFSDRSFGSTYMTNHFFNVANHIIYRLSVSILNNKNVLPLAYKEIDIHQLTHAFSKIEHNLLVIGRTRVQIINASTCHPDHFIGTHRAIHLKPTLRDSTKWTKLHDFILRFATPGSLIHVFLLRDSKKQATNIGCLSKSVNSVY